MWPFNKKCSQSKQEHKTNPNKVDAWEDLDGRLHRTEANMALSNAKIRKDDAVSHLVGYLMGDRVTSVNCNYGEYGAEFSTERRKSFYKRNMRLETLAELLIEDFEFIESAVKDCRKKAAEYKQARENNER